MFDPKKFTRPLLYAVLVTTAMMLWQAWQVEHAPKPLAETKALPSQVDNQQVSQIEQGAHTPSPSVHHTAAAVEAVPQDRLVHVRTDKLSIEIDRKGGYIVGAKLLDYADKLGSKQSISILNSGEQPYVAQGGVTGDGGLIFRSQHAQYAMNPSDNQLTVMLSGQDAAGVTYRKTYQFSRGSYVIKLATHVTNHSLKPWVGNSYDQLSHHKIQAASGGMFAFRTFNGASYYQADKPYTKLPYADMDKADLDKSVEGGWVSVQQRYFISAWVADKTQQNHYFSRVLPNSTYVIGVLGPQLRLLPNEQSVANSTLYVGPEITDYLKPLAPGLALTIDYGWFWMVSQAIFWVMTHIHALLGNWGLAIILVTFLIKLVFYKLSETSYRSMAKMRLLQPKMEQIKQRHGSDREKLGQATMELYRKEKINPLGGCLPMVIQIPFFIALYWVLIEAVQLRHAPLVAWIMDLSARDPYYILPLLMGGSMFLQQKLSPAPPDPAQAKMMMFLPVIFTVMFLNFPSGLVLYWLTNNLLSVAQQWYIMRKVNAQLARG